MNADLTFNTIAFKKSFDEKDGSERQSVARGIATPDKLIIKSQDYIDSATKVAGRRYTARFDRTDVDAVTGARMVESIYFVIALPNNQASVNHDVLVATFKAAVADASFITAVVNNEK